MQVGWGKVQLKGGQQQLSLWGALRAPVEVLIPETAGLRPTLISHYFTLFVALFTLLLPAQPLGRMFAWRATFIFSILALALILSSPQEIPQVDRTGLQTFPAKHVA